MQVEYLEIVTPDIEAYCAAMTASCGLEFSDPVEALGNARVAVKSEGGRIGVRAPMHDAEEPTTRPYYLVDDVAAATEAAEKAGGMVAHPPLEIPGQGEFSVVFIGGAQFGFWKNA